MLDVDPGASTNRTVYTFVGEPASVMEGALNAAREAENCIDMSKHKGEHPRFGAMDVCPFVPVSNISMPECVTLAREFGKRLAEELNVPVFLYEHAAKEDYRRLLPDVRQGEYEGLAARFRDPAWHHPPRQVSAPIDADEHTLRLKPAHLRGLRLGDQGRE